MRMLKCLFWIILINSSIINGSSFSTIVDCDEDQLLPPCKKANTGYEFSGLCEMALDGECCRADSLMPTWLPTFMQEGVAGPSHTAVDGVALLDLNAHQDQADKRLDFPQCSDRARESDLFLILPPYHSGYSRSLYYMNQAHEIVSIYLSGNDTHKMQYGIVQCSRPLHLLCAKSQCIQSWDITYSKNYSWKLELWVNTQGIELKEVAAGKVHKLFVDSWGNLVCQKSGEVGYVVANGLLHLQYVPSLQSLAFVAQKGLSIAIAFGLHEDKVVLVKDHENFTFFSGYNESKYLIDSHNQWSMANFIASVLPVLSGKKCYMNVRNDSSVVNIGHGGEYKRPQWSIGYSHAGGALQHWVQAEDGSRTSLYRLQFHHSLSKNYRMVFKKDPDDIHLSFAIVKENKEKVPVFFLKSGEKTSALGKTTFASLGRIVCPHYKDDCIEIVVLSNDEGYLRLYTPDLLPYQIKLAAVKKFRLEESRDLAVIEDRKISILEGLEVAPILQKETLNCSGGCFWEQVSFVEPTSLQWVRCSHSEFDYQGMASAELSASLCHQHDVCFLFSINGQRRQKFHVYYDDATLYFSMGEVSQMKIELFTHLKKFAALSIKAVKDERAYGKYKIVVSLNGSDKASVRLMYQPGVDSDTVLYSGAIGWALFKNQRHSYITTEHTFMNVLFDLNELKEGADDFLI